MKREVCKGQENGGGGGGGVWDPEAWAAFPVGVGDEDNQHLMS